MSPRRCEGIPVTREVPVDLGELMLVGRWKGVCSSLCPLRSSLPSLSMPVCLHSPRDKGTTVGAMPADSTGLWV